MAKKTAKAATRVEMEKCPGWEDPQALLEHGIAGMVRVSKSDDLAAAMKAAQWLAHYAESLMNGKRQAKEKDSSTVSPPLRVC